MIMETAPFAMQDRGKTEAETKTGKYASRLLQDYNSWITFRLAVLTYHLPSWLGTCWPCF